MAISSSSPVFSSPLCPLCFPVCLCVCVWRRRGLPLLAPGSASAIYNHSTHLVSLNSCSSSTQIVVSPSIPHPFLCLPTSLPAIQPLSLSQSSSGHTHFLASLLRLSPPPSLSALGHTITPHSPTIIIILEINIHFNRPSLCLSLRLDSPL